MAEQDIAGLEIGLDNLLGGIDELGGIDSGTTFGAATPEQQKQNMFALDRPIPGQSMTVEPGQRAWETPPQFDKPEDAMHFLAMNSMSPDFAQDLIRLIDAGVPLATLAEPVLMNGTANGKWSVDTAMLIAEPLMALWAGMAQAAGITPEMTSPKSKKTSIDPRPIKAMFKKAKEEAEIPEVEEDAGFEEETLLGKRR